MTQTIDKMSAILVALEMINDLSKSSATRADIEATRAYIRSIEDIVPIEIVMQLYETISYFEVFQHHLNNRFR